MGALRSMKNDRISSFQIDVPAMVLSDLQQRLARTRWSDSAEETGWDAGTDARYLRKSAWYLATSDFVATRHFFTFSGETC